MKIGALKNFVKITRKHLYESLLFNNVIEKGTLAQVFSCEIYEIFKNSFFTEHLWMTASET